MGILDAVRLALAQLRVQKLKSFFTLLGVMIGVMFLITVVSIVEGMSDYVENDFAGKLIGVNTFTYSRAPNFQAGPDEIDWRAIQRRARIYAREADMLREVLPPGTRVTVNSESFLYANAAGARPRQVQAVATDAEYFAIKDFVVEQGRAFSPQEVSAGSRVVVIGTEVAKHFFAGLDPIERELRVAGTPYRVIGVIEEQGSVFGFSLDRLAIFPHTTTAARTLRPRGDVGSIIMKASSAELMADGIEEARELLRGTRGDGPGEPDSFELQTSDAALSFFDELKGRLILFGTALPAIGLVVGAMVIMNIMLVAVAERTREIGVRKALGARRWDILAQFLVEAATLSVIGAAIGIGLGIGLAQVVAAVSPLPASVAPWSIGAALALGCGVGIAAGFYPASRAARLDPIVALRQE